MSKKDDELLRREGFWYSTHEPNLPMPIGVAWGGRRIFLKRLAEVEANLRPLHYKGFSLCRLCGEHNGSQEFIYKGWTWPSGSRHYLEKHDVRPSLAFEEFIHGENLPTEITTEEYYG